jgi:hypothetical protein
MAKDSQGREVKVGDSVTLRGTVTSADPGNGGNNVSIEINNPDQPTRPRVSLNSKALNAHSPQTAPAKPAEPINAEPRDDVRRDDRDPGASEG